MLRDILWYGIGTLVALALVGLLVFLLVRDTTQKKHSVLRKRLQRARVVEEKYLRVANYAMNMNREIDMSAHSCGVRHARGLRREHVCIVQASGQSVALNMLYPYPESKAKMKVA